MMGSKSLYEHSKPFSALSPPCVLLDPACHQQGVPPKQTGPAKGFFLPLLLVWGSGPGFLQIEPILIVKGAILIKNYLN